MTFFAGLYSYEIVLLVLGVILFVALLVAFLRCVFTDKPYTTLLPFFLLPVVMIGYSSIESIEYNNGVVTIQNTTAALAKTPNDPTLRATLQTTVSKIAPRPAPNDQVVASIAKAQYALGDEAGATANLKKISGASAALPEVKELQTKISLINQLKNQTSQVEAKPEDSAARVELQKTASQLKSMGIANPTGLSLLQHADELLAKPATPAIK